MEFREFFKNHLREIRRQSEKTQQQVADGLGIPRRHYQKFESGESLPNIENFIALADYFGVSLDYLAGRTDEKSHATP